jgi:acetyl-CoA carboxylase carboxyltransferase component
MEVEMSEINRLEILLAKKQAVLQAGGQEKYDEQHKAGKLTARERVSMLFDADSFVETGAFVEKSFAPAGFEKQSAAGEGVITGFGTIDERPVYAFLQDFTVLGGSFGDMHAQKIIKVMDMAAKNGVPIIGVLDSGGARLQEGAASLNALGAIFKKMSALSGVVPLISVIAGPCAGGAAFMTALSDFVFMTEKISAMFTAGPQVFSASTGTDYIPETLGGARVHNEMTGNAHFICENEKECFSKVKKLLSFIPSNNIEEAPSYECEDDLNRQLAGLDAEKQADIRSLVVSIADLGDFLETMPLFATDMVTGFLRLNGWNVGVIANSSEMYITRDASDKAARFVRFCDAYDIPLLILTDTNGFVLDIKEEHGGLVRHGAKLIFAFGEASVPMINVITGKAIGAGYVAMCCKSLGADIVYAWPDAVVSCMSAEAATNILFSKKITQADNPMQARSDLTEEYLKTYASPWEAAKAGYVDDIIMPSETRQRVIAALELIISKRENRPPKKHGIMPV